MDNLRIAKQLVRLAKNLVALDEEGDGSGFQLMHDMENAGMHPLDNRKEIDRLEQDELDRAEKAGKKYILYKQEHGLWRIRACKDFGNVTKGYLGGLVESEQNLSQDGDCWVSGNARVCGEAWVYGNAEVWGNAWGLNNAKVYGNAVVSRNARVDDNAEVYGNAEVDGDAVVSGNAKIYGEAWVYGNAEVSGDAKVDYDVSTGKITE